jgi:hypothetical protein
MRKYIFFFIAFFFFAFGESFACSVNPPDIPDPETMKQEIRDEAKAQTKDCIEARKNGNATTAVDADKWYICPSGEYWEGDTSMVIDEGTLFYNIATAIAFKKIDEKAKKYSESLQCSREPSPVVWMESIRKAVDGVGETPGYADVYTRVCDTEYVLSMFDQKTLEEKPEIATSLTFPQILCKKYAEAKWQSITNLWHMLMSAGISKSYQNDKDKLIDTVKGKYKNLLEKFHNYLMIFDRAIKALDKFTKTPVS